MALLDVSDIVLDPDFSDLITCRRSTQTIGNNGRAINSPGETVFRGVVTQNGGNILNRLDGGEHASGAIIIHSKFPLIAQAPDITADVVIFRGKEYTVVRVDDYSNFGAGFTAAECDLINMAGATIQEN
jgi:galactose-6-phosphate isomerase